jgi:hypothetical protein
VAPVVLVPDLLGGRVHRALAPPLLFALFALFAPFALSVGCFVPTLDLSRDAGAPPGTYPATLTRTFDDDGGCPRPVPTNNAATVTVDGVLIEPAGVDVQVPDGTVCSLSEPRYSANDCRVLVPEGYEQIGGDFDGSASTPALWLRWRLAKDSACTVIDEWRLSP